MTKILDNELRHSQSNQRLLLRHRQGKEILLQASQRSERLSPTNQQRECTKSQLELQELKILEFHRTFQFDLQSPFLPCTNQNQQFSRILRKNFFRFERFCEFQINFTFSV